MATRMKQQGFVLISVLLITTISTMFAISAIGENRLQERIAGNQVKEINARSKAEEGVFAAYSRIQNMENATQSEMIVAINNQQLDPDSYQLTASAGSGPTFLLITSEGKYQGAVAYLKAEIEVQNSPGIPEPSSAVVSCNGVHVENGASIDSFDSRNGTYSDDNKGSNADIIALNGDMTVEGGINLAGNLNVNGNLDQQGSANFGGDVAASGNVIMNNAPVSGNIYSGGDVTAKGVSVGDAGNSDSGNIHAQGNFAPNSSTAVTGSVNYAGDFTKPWNSYNIDEYFPDQINNETPIDPTMSNHECNAKDIANALPVVADMNTFSNMNEGHGGRLAELEFNESTAQVFDSASTTAPYVSVSPSDVSAPLWGDEDKSVYVFDDFEMNNTMITIVGDVTIMIKGDLTTSGGGTGFKFKDGDTDSSLTILIEGQVHLGSSTKVFENATVDADKLKSPFTIYSSFESTSDIDEKNATDTAVYLNGAAGMYAQVYAPLGNIEYAAGGAMMGSLEGRNVKLSGAGTVHYDEALKDVSGLENSGGGGVKFASVYYHYPD